LKRTTFFERATWVMLACSLLFGGLQSSLAQDASQASSEALEAAVQLYNEGDYVGASHGLNQIDDRDLDDDERAQLAEYVQRASLAVSMQTKAGQDVEAGELALAEGRIDDAKRLFASVLENQFAGSHARAKAEEQSKKLEADVHPEADDSQPEAMSEDLSGQLRALRARTLTRQGLEAVDHGRFSEAERLFRKALTQVPGYPEALSGLDRVGKHEMVEADAGALLDRIKSRNAVAWQRVESTYREAEREVINHVTHNRYELAKQVVLRARQVVEGGRAFADPVERYDALRHDAESLLRYVEDEERRFNERAVKDQRSQALTEARERQRRTVQAKNTRVNALLAEALLHRKDRDYDAALNVLRQVSAVDPTNDQARFLIDELEDRRAYEDQKSMRDRFYRNQQAVLIDVDESRIPWWQDLVYPKNWQEIISRPSRRLPGSGRAGNVDPDLRSRLDKPVQVDFLDEPLGRVIEMLADAHDTNMSVAWRDLAAAGVTADSPVRLRLGNPVPLRTALREVLDQVGGARVELGFEPLDGLVKIATREMLDRNTYEDVYDVGDLLLEVPDFNDAPRMDLTDTRTFAGGPSGNTSHSSEIWPGDDVDGEVIDKRTNVHADELIDLIRRSIDPDSWRDKGGSVGTIDEFNGQLVITQTPSGHARVGGLLSKLREQRAIQIAVEARFITVQSNYLEELGIDLDIILNAGNAGFDFLPGQGGTILTDPVLGSRLLMPRSFSRLGFTPATPGVGTAIDAVDPAALAITQPFGIPGLVPGRGNSSIGGRTGSPIPVLNNILQFTNPATLTSDLPGSFAGNPTLQPAFNLFGSFLDNIQVDFLVRATQADSRTTLLTAPRLVLFNGQRAWAAVVNQQSFVSSLQPVVDAQGQAPTARTIETGAVLDAEAVVSADRRYVTLTLRPSVGRLLGIQTFGFNIGAGGGGLFVQLPNITRQVVRTTVSVPDGGTLLIGGQKIAGEIEVESGVPVLSKIPILKRLYSGRTLVKDEQVLLILIKPKIIIQNEAEQEAFPSFSER
jgi:general secretion pathway protein D